MKCPESIEELQDLEKLIPFCKIELYQQAKAKIESGAAKSVSEAARQIGEETGRPIETIRRRINEEATVRGAQLSEMAGTDKHRPEIKKAEQSILDTAKAIRQERRELSQEIKREVREIPLPAGIYNIVYADPPWKYNDTCEDGSIQSKGADKHYPLMTIEQLCELPVKNILAENAVMFFWVTSPLLSECWPIISAWGFKYKSSFVWDKVRHNMGHYNSVRHEFLLICTRGSFLPENKELHDSVISIEKSKTHSQKPQYFRELIDKMYPNGNRIELFAREKTENWDVYGNEV